MSLRKGIVMRSRFQVTVEPVLKDPSQPHLCYCLQYRIWDRITRHTQGKGQQYNLKI